jgi:hypothetical protein
MIIRLSLCLFLQFTSFLINYHCSTIARSCVCMFVNVEGGGLFRGASAFESVCTSLTFNCESVIQHAISPLSLLWKNKRRLMRSPCKMTTQTSDCNRPKSEVVGKTATLFCVLQNDRCCKQLVLRLARAIAQALSRWLPTAAARVQTRVWSSGICGGQSGAGACFLRVLRFPLPIFIPPNSPSS